MGEQDKIQHGSDPEELRLFSKALLNDLHALEKMLAEGIIESGKRRFGAEQEVVLVNDGWRPAMVNLKVLEHLEDKRFTTELGRFNIEYNLDPLRVDPSLGRDVVGADHARRKEQDQAENGCASHALS